MMLAKSLTVFLSALLLVGIAWAAEDSIVGEEVHYSANGTELHGFVAYDKSQPGKRPGVLIVHEWWGHTDYVRMRARMLAEMGYTALAVDMYGEGKTAEHPGDAQQFMRQVMSDMDKAERRFLAAKSVLSDHPTVLKDDIAAIGYCFGGAIVLHMARAGADLDGVASFHGNLATQSLAEPGDIKADILVLHGAEDPLVPQEQVQAFKQEMNKADADYEFIAYPGALHGFTNPEATRLGEAFDLPLAYSPEADRKSWQRLEQFLREIFSE